MLKARNCSIWALEVVTNVCFHQWKHYLFAQSYTIKCIIFMIQVFGCCHHHILQFVEKKDRGIFGYIYYMLSYFLIMSYLQIAGKIVWYRYFYIYSILYNMLNGSFFIKLKVHSRHRLLWRIYQKLRYGRVYLYRHGAG